MSITYRNANPSNRPTTAGIICNLPMCSAISIPGISNDHTDAATITPPANPSNDFCNSEGILFFIKKTNAEPIIVPNKGISIILNISISINYSYLIISDGEILLTILDGISRTNHIIKIVAKFRTIISA